MFFLGITSDPKNHTNCTRPDIEQFPRPLIGYEARREGGLIVHVLVALYMFLGLAILCDEYFVPSLEIMCKSKYIFKKYLIFYNYKQLFYKTI